MKRLIKRLSVSVLILAPIGYFLFCYSYIDTEAMASNPVDYRVLGGKGWSDWKPAIDESLRDDIVAWLETNRHGWAPSLTTYVPRHVFYGERMGINIQGNLIIVEYKRLESKKAFTQITRRLGKKDREFWDSVIERVGEPSFENR